jgi:hypothetical protein
VLPEEQNWYEPDPNGQMLDWQFSVGCAPPGVTDEKLAHHATTARWALVQSAHDWQGNCVPSLVKRKQPVPLPSVHVW